MLRSDVETGHTALRTDGPRRLEYGSNGFGVQPATAGKACRHALRIPEPPASRHTAPAATARRSDGATACGTCS